MFCVPLSVACDNHLKKKKKLWLQCSGQHCRGPFCGLGWPIPELVGPPELHPSQTSSPRCVTSAEPGVLSVGTCVLSLSPPEESAKGTPYPRTVYSVQCSQIPGPVAQPARTCQCHVGRLVCDCHHPKNWVLGHTGFVVLDAVNAMKKMP